MAHPARAHVMLMTPEEFLVDPLDNVKAELVRGELRVNPPGGGPHGCAGSNLIAMLIAHVRPKKLGRVFGDGVGYQMLQLPCTVRVPDASFVRADQLPPDGIQRGLFKFAPAIAIEVLSPSETASELQEKLQDYRVSGTDLVWVADPVRRTVMVVATYAPLLLLQEGDTLTGGVVLPEFSCAVGEIFEGIARDLRGRRRSGQRRKLRVTRELRVTARVGSSGSESSGFRMHCENTELRLQNAESRTYAGVVAVRCR